MTMLRGRSQFKSMRRVVVKIGSRLIAEDPLARTLALASEAKALVARQVAVAFVSSGAIALGRAVLGMTEKPRELPLLQAAAAIGQVRLMEEWTRALGYRGLAAGQVLLTHDDVRSRRRYLAARQTLSALFSLGAVPVINENDTVSVDEIKFGDNDRLAALVCSLVEAELLIILTDVEGLHDADPREGGVLIAEVNDIDTEAAPVAGGTTSGPTGLGTGGMASKVAAARIAGRFGVPTVVASGRRERVVASILDGEPIGTVFWPSVSRLQSRKQWIAFVLKPAGRLLVDEGARLALLHSGRSLLPSGVVAVEGSFGEGEAVAIVGPDGAEFARGLTAFSSEDLARIRGRKSHEIAAILGAPTVDEVVHRDDLAIV